MFTSRTIFTICVVGIVVFVGQWLVFTQQYDKSRNEEMQQLAMLDKGYDDATRRDLIDKGESNLGLETASANAGFKKGSPLDHLYQHQEIRKIITGTWVREKSEDRSDIVKVKFEGKNYYLYKKTGSGKEELKETGLLQILSDQVVLNPSNDNRPQKFIELVDRRYFILFDLYDGNTIEFAKIS